MRNVIVGGELYITGYESFRGLNFSMRVRVLLQEKGCYSNFLQTWVLDCKYRDSDACGIANDRML